ncbi:MAG: hypothetical protein RIR62_1372 [Pseudomonadota bacterium]|jgi:uncharacterized protein YecT (DUF1311 family)
MVRFALALLLLPVLAAPLHAEGADCADPITQVDMNACAMAEFQAQDAVLNAVWSDAVGLMEGVDALLPEAERGALAALRDAQRRWIAYRDAACAAEAWLVRGGSMEPLVLYSCLARLTAERTAGLQALQTN